MTFHNKKITTSTTPIDAKYSSVNVIHITDSDDEPDKQGSGNISLSTCSATEKGKNSESKYAQNSKENSDLGENLLSAVTPKRKQNRNVVISESENDDDEDEDDDLPISSLLRNHVEEISVDQLENVVDDDDAIDDDMPISQFMNMKKVSKRRLKRLRKCGQSHDDDRTSCVPTNDDDDDDDDDDESEDEEGNLKGFIVDDFDKSNCKVTSSKSQDGGSNGDDEDSDSKNSQDLQDNSKDCDSQDESDEDINFGKILSKIQRKKEHKIKWELEPDMLANFGKDPVLCMKAVCAIYRQEISEEKRNYSTIGRIGRGFSLYDVARGSTLAEFITDGNPSGGIKKTVEELQEFDPKAVEVCSDLASKYSTQLYKIFQNKEDPFFP